MGPATVAQEVLAAAHESSADAERAERRDIGEATLEQLRADVARLSLESLTGEPFSLFMEMRRVRNRVCAALERRVWPRDAAQLYLLAGCLNDLMAVAAAGLGCIQAAEELIRAGWAYATMAGSRPLMAHLRLQHASILHWDNGPRPAHDVAGNGLSCAWTGPAAACLRLNRAPAAPGRGGNPPRHRGRR